jgi:hypothetical protein
MYNFLTASKDASVYLQQPNQNTGLDQILEVSKVYYGGTKDISRALIKFDISSLHTGSHIEEASLLLKETKSEEIPLEYTLYAHPISQSWEMGIGTRFDDISTEGISWRYREGNSKIDWLNDTTNDGITTNFAAGSTGSYAGYGGVWYTNYQSTKLYSYNTADVVMNIKSMLNAWVSGSIPNDGLILKHENSLEDNTEDYGILKFFSKETHTIYQPKIRIGWDDQIFQTGSLTPLVSEQFKIGITNSKSEYKVGTSPKVRIFGREMYPVKTFNNSFNQYSQINYLPITSYYQIIDFESGDVIIPFSEYSKISCDENGNYVQLDLRNWETDRVYKIEFKITFNDGDVYFDNDITFSVVK